VQVAALDFPPGNLAVSPQGRVFFTFHPEAHPDVKLAELVDGKPKPYPDLAAQEGMVTPLGTRIDRQGRLWVVDLGFHGVRGARLDAYDLATNRRVLHHEFSRGDAGIGSFFNDLEVSPDGSTVYIADCNIFGRHPAIVVFDVKTETTRRLLEGHPSVQPQDWLIRAPGRDMIVLRGLLALRPGVDSIALDARGEWLYYGPMSHDSLFRVRTADLRDPALSQAQLAARVERYSDKPLSDGMSMDDAGNVYVTDVEHRGIAEVSADRALHTLVKDDRIRWADGLSWGPDGWLYFTDSAIQDQLLELPSHIRSRAPYFIWRVRPGTIGTPGQ
jgi:sugar lactone lactonase YvrE